MGRIKTTLIKRTTEKLMQEHEFEEDFEKNKKIVNGISSSKKVTNQIAGYITRLEKRRKSDA